MTKYFMCTFIYLANQRRLKSQVKINGGKFLKCLTFKLKTRGIYCFERKKWLITLNLKNAILPFFQILKGFFFVVNGDSCG